FVKSGPGRGDRGKSRQQPDRSLCPHAGGLAGQSEPRVALPRRAEWPDSPDGRVGLAALAARPRQGRIVNIGSLVEQTGENGCLEAGAAAVPAVVVPIGVLTIVVGAAATLGLSDGQLVGWIVAL